MALEKVALVTAGGSGMGAAAARRLAADGFRVAILSSSGKGEALASELGGLGFTGSNRSNDDLKRAVDGVMARWGRIDALVNSAGHGPRAGVLELTDEQWHTGLDVYLMNVIRPTRLVAPHMQAQKSGAIVNISTAWAFEPSAMFPTSAVFRAGLAAFTKLFTDSYAASNVRMNNVLPGWIDSLPATEERRDAVPMKRYGKAEEIAATIAFLVSDGAGYITGDNTTPERPSPAAVWQQSGNGPGMGGGPQMGGPGMGGPGMGGLPGRQNRDGESGSESDDQNGPNTSPGTSTEQQGQTGTGA